jgi:hypothetical protein
MGLRVAIDWGKRKVEAWGCLTSGCVRFYEGESEIYASIEDVRKDGVKVEKSVTLRKRGNYDELIDNIINGRLSAFWDEPRADEGKMLEMLKFVAENLRSGTMKYVGVKTVHISPRGIRIYFRLRYSEEDERPHMNVELIAEKDGERLNYQAYGDVNDYRPMLEETAKAIAAYTLFSNFISEHAQTEQQGAQ